MPLLPRKTDFNQRNKPLTASIFPSFILWEVYYRQTPRTGSLFSHPAFASPTCRVETLTRTQQADNARPPLPQLKIAHRSKVHSGWSKFKTTPVLIHNEGISLWKKQALSLLPILHKLFNFEKEASVKVELHALPKRTDFTQNELSRVSCLRTLSGVKQVIEGTYNSI